MNVNGGRKKNSGQFVTDSIVWPFLNLLHEAFFFFFFGCRISASHTHTHKKTFDHVADVID